MNEIAFVSGRESATQDSLPPRLNRNPPSAIKVLLPVWGYNYVHHFLERGLRTLLAPGNIPGLAAELPTEFVVLTSEDDAVYIQDHPAFRRLMAACKTTIRCIDHLITDGNYSTTVTLAYLEAVRSAGDKMIDTCFFFLVSDYIVADGSLVNAFKRIRQGRSAVVVGNFQVVEEDARHWLDDKLPSPGCELVLQPRELMQWALNYLHPATLANTVNIPLSHNTHANRLFWRVDSQTMIGRFYLMHMLCVRPELSHFIISSSCDYSFVPEMCPSGNVEAMTDSDEYLVIEMQPRSHESAFLRPGPILARSLARSLSDWTTAVHRRNPHNVLKFHAADLPSGLDQIVVQSESFVSDVACRLRPEPKPHRGHPFWRGAMAAFLEAKGRRLSDEEWYYALGSSPAESRPARWIFWRLKGALMGRPPDVRPWHPIWPDYRAVRREVDEFFANKSARMLILSNEPTAFSVALADSGERVHRYRCTPFLKSPSDRFKPLREAFDLCLMELSEGELSSGREFVDRVTPLMKNGGSIVVSVLNRRGLTNARGFKRGASYNSTKFVRADLMPTKVSFVRANILRWGAYRGMFRVRTISRSNPALGVFAAIVSGGVLLCGSLAGNIGAMRGVRSSTRGIASSMVMRLQVDRKNYDGNLSNAASPKINSSETVSGLDRFGASGARTREPQYDRCVELRDRIGLATLGLMTNQIWHDDPRRLAFLLARYKFVAKMLSGRRNAGEVGCGDAFGTRIVLQEVPDVTVYDFDRAFIEDIRSRRDSRWPIRAEVHDIIAEPLPRKHEALFSLDVIEHVAPSDEHAYLHNLCRSLEDNGILIIGSPSLESQAHSSEPSKIGHINCKSGNQLKALLSNHFGEVLLFSMNDELVHTGFSPMAHYLFAICTRAK
jgi:Methyltransferase domain